MSRMGARWGRNITGVCPSAALDSLPPSEPRAPFPATAVGATSVAVAFPSFYCPRRRLTERADPLPVPYFTVGTRVGLMCTTTAFRNV